MKIKIHQVIIFCVVSAVIGTIIYFLIKPSDSPTSISTITNSTNDSTSIAKKYLFDENCKNVLGMSTGYSANKENNFNTIDTAFKEDILKNSECIVDFIKQNSDKKESDIILFTKQDFIQTITDILTGTPGIKFPNCGINSRQLEFLLKFLNEGKCYPDINELIIFIKNNINNNYRPDETVNGNNNNIIIFLPEESAKYNKFLESHNCT